MKALCRCSGSQPELISVALPQSNRNNPAAVAEMRQLPISAAKLAVRHFLISICRCGCSVFQLFFCCIIFYFFFFGSPLTTRTNDDAQCPLTSLCGRQNCQSCRCSTLKLITTNGQVSLQRVSFWRAMYMLSIHTHKHIYIQYIQ